MDEVALEEITDYAAEDADIPLQLKPVLAKLLTENQLSTLFENLEMPLVEVLAEMEYTGIRVDIKRLKKLSKQFGARLDALEAEIYELADGNFNIASPKQLAHILFEKLELPVIKKTKTGPSTDADVLEQLAEHHPLPEKIIEYRQFAKLKNTYVDALPELVHPKTGRVHASFNQVVAATGRLSSSDPNLQNIPVRSEEGREIRSAFLPGKDGWKLLGADYSQIELRVLAHYAQDEALIKAFDRDEDIHALVASQIHDVSPADVTDDATECQGGQLWCNLRSKSLRSCQGAPHRPRRSG
jgi:DNA polymerase-1